MTRYDPHDLVEQIKTQAVQAAEQAVHVLELEERLRKAERQLETPEARQAVAERELNASVVVLLNGAAAKQHRLAESLGFVPPEEDR